MNATPGLKHSLDMNSENYSIDVCGTRGSGVTDLSVQDKPFTIYYPWQHVSFLKVLRHWWLQLLSFRHCRSEVTSSEPFIRFNWKPELFFFLRLTQNLTVKNIFSCAVTVAQQIERPLKKLQIFDICGFESRPQHEVVGKTPSLRQLWAKMEISLQFGK